MIVVDDVYKRYLTDHGPGRWILDGVSFTIPPKVSVGLVGGNGAGKSTLLRLIGGVDVPSRGRVERHCRVSWPMGFGGGLQGSLTGRQNAKFICRVQGHEGDIPDRLAFIQSFAELGEAFDEPIKTYSSGMRSRLQFGLSLAFDFDVYISDEVTAAGDAAFRKKAREAFKKVADHASIIMVSHGEGTLRQFCTAGIWLHQGKAIWYDDLEDALRAYRESRGDDPVESPVDVEPMSSGHAKCPSLLTLLRQGVDGGEPATVTFQEGKKLMLLAEKEGIVLLGRKQISQKGYRIKPGELPVIRRFHRPLAKQPVELFDLNRQCEETGGDQHDAE